VSMMEIKKGDSKSWRSIVLRGNLIMSYATLLAYVGTDRMPEQPLRLGACLAGQFNAALIGSSAIAIRPPVVAEGTVTAETIGALGEEGAVQEHVDDLARYLNRHRITGGAWVILHRDGSDAAFRSRLARRPARHRRLRALPPRRVYMRRRDARIAGGKSNMRPDVSLSLRI